ncbi:uncharacterized protein LOC124910788 [Impatiens glandulifera]|uniref:uncharacterized protein LOC124910788 n=1 Tax=Impatiens glandulifera TaxID=253017 RepID=UPI001FB0B909|nr:uncharacterized protein LOC124910788 [Impatiens glandulifera]
MEKSEQTLIPEWLKSSGNATSGFTITNQILSSTVLNKDDHGSAMQSRNRVSASVNNQDSGRSSFSDRATSSYLRWGSNNNGSDHGRSHNSFGSRNNRYREWDSRDQEKSNLSDIRRHDYSNQLDNIFPVRPYKDLRRSQSLANGRGFQPLSGKLASNLSNNSKRVINTVHKNQFEREFPSLGTDERQLNPDMRRVSSPGLGSAIQSLPVGVSTLIGGDGWTSALAEVPVIVGSNGSSGASPQSIPPNMTSIASSTVVGLNMAETVAQGTPRGNSTLQLPSGNPRLDELSLKQSRQLVPLKPTPKSSGLNLTDKSKAKISHPHQVSSQVANFSSVGKLQVLKPSRERNEVPPPTKDSVSPPPTVSLPSRTSPGPTVSEKNANAQSRNDFFNSVRKNSMTVPSSSPSAVVASANKNNEDEEEVVAGKIAGGNEDALGKEITSVGNNNVVKEEPKNAAAKAEESVENGKILHSEEEEVAFMRSLGWEESNYNTEDDEGLTEEEISAFFKHINEHLTLRSSYQTACRRLQSVLGYATCPQSSSPRSSHVDS